MLRLLTSVLITTFAFAAQTHADSQREIIHNFFKGRRALQEGVGIRLNPSQSDGASPEAAEVARLLETCATESVQKGNRNTETLKGTTCEGITTKVTDSALSGSTYTMNTTQNVASTGNLRGFTGIASSALKEKAVANLKKISENEYDVVATSIDRTDSVVAADGTKVAVSEKQTYVKSSETITASVSATAGKIKIVGEYRSVKGQATCKLNGKAASCEEVLYLYGFGPGSNIDL